MKKNIIYILIISAVLLLIGNIVLKIFYEREPEPEASEIEINRIDSIFNACINQFQLDSTWVRKVFIDSPQYDSLDYVYKVALPSDLPPIIVLRDLRESFAGTPVELLSDEKIVNSYTTLNIFSDDQLKLQATFSVNEDLTREHTKLAILLTDFEYLTESEKLKLLRSPIEFSLLMVPSEQTDSLLKKILEYEKTYSIIITDGIEDARYKMNPDGSKTLLEEAVRQIAWNYAEAQLYLIDNSSEIFNSATFSFVNEKFKNRDILLRPKKQFIQLPEKLSEANSLLNFYLESGIGKEGKIIIISAQNFLELEKVLLLSKKKGAKFYSPQNLFLVNSK